MVQMTIKRKKGNNILEILGQVGEAKDYSRKSFLESNEFREVMISLYEKGYTEKEIIEMIAKAAKANGIEDLKYSQKEIKAILQNTDVNAKEKIQQQKLEEGIH